jgi:hypothetical protein
VSHNTFKCSSYSPLSVALYDADTNNALMDDGLTEVVSRPDPLRD